MDLKFQNPASSLESISGVILSGNAPCSMKWLYFAHAIISTLKNCK